MQIPANYRLITMFLAALVAITSCNSSEKKIESANELTEVTTPNDSGEKVEPDWTVLPEVKNIGDFKRTEFVVTLENPISESKNVIYGPAFLYAWDKVKEALRSPIKISNLNSLDFKLLNKSDSYQNSLMDSEYTATVEEAGDGAIIAKAFFKKILPFEKKLQVLDDPILFDRMKVRAFGMNYYDESLVEFTKILYYKDDNNFILKLSPTDKQHEIILVKGLGKYQSLKEAIKLSNALIDKGKKEKTNPKISWKYEIVAEDIFSIPMIKFNIATQIQNLEGQKFSTNDGKGHIIDMAFHRIGFILNENGAVIVDSAVCVLDSAGMEPIITHPKKMIFNKPFLIIIKRTDKTNPYFVMKVDNAELLEKKK